MKTVGYIYGLIVVAVICGCATINSEKQADRLAALSKIVDQQELSQCVVEARYDDVKEAALSRITNSTYLVSLAMEGRISKRLRDSAASKLSDESDIAKVILAGTVTEKTAMDLIKQIKSEDLAVSIAVQQRLSEALHDKASQKVVSEESAAKILITGGISESTSEYLAGCVKSEVLSMRILFDGNVSENIALNVAKNIRSESAAMQLVKADKIAHSVKLLAIESVNLADNLLAICTHNSYSDDLRDYALKALSGNGECMRKAFLENESAAFAIKSFMKLSQDDISSEAIQKGIFNWCKRVFTEDQSREDWLKMLVANLADQDSLWWIVSQSSFPNSLKALAIKNIGDAKKLVEVVLDSTYSEDVRTVAADKIKDNPAELEKCILAIDDVNVGLAIAEMLPKDRCGSETIQNQIAKWFGSASDAKTMARALSCLNVDFDLDTPQYQGNLVKMIAEADTKENRALARNYLVNPSTIIEMAMQKNGETEDVALWAVDMIASNLWLDRLIGACKNPMVRGRAVSRFSNESQIAKVAKEDSDTAVRVIAIKHLSSLSTDLLRALIEDADPVVEKYALQKLGEYDPLMAEGLKKTIEKKEAARKAAEAEMRKKEELADREQAKRDVAQQVYVKTTAERQILDCQAGAKVYQAYNCAPDCVLELSGPILELEHNWIFADEITLHIEANGRQMDVRCKMKKNIPDNLSKGDRVTVSGKFRSGDQSEVILEKTVLK